MGNAQGPFVSDLEGGDSSSKGGDGGDGPPLEGAVKKMDLGVRAKHAKAGGAKAFIELLKDEAQLGDPAKLVTLLTELVSVATTLPGEVRKRQGGGVTIPEGVFTMAEALVAAMRRHQQAAASGGGGGGSGGGGGGLSQGLRINKLFQKEESKADAKKRKKAEKKAQEAFDTLVRVQRLGCEVLSHVSKIQHLKGMVLRAGGMEAIVDAMKTFPKARDLHWWGANAMFYLCRDGAKLEDANLLRLRKAGGKEVLEGSAAEFVSDETLQPHLACVLRMLRTLNTKVVSDGFVRDARGRVAFDSDPLNIERDNRGREKAPSFGGFI